MPTLSPLCITEKLERSAVDANTDQIVDFV